MRIASTPVGETLQAKLDAIQQLEVDGFAGAWLPSRGHDAMTTLALSGALTERIELGTFVQPTYSRHPVSMAQSALAVQAATGNRFALGIGLSHQVVIEDAWGLDFSKPVRHTREYLTVLGPLLRGEAVDFDGDEFRIHTQLAVPDAEPPPIIVAALGPQMLRVTGRLADGTALWLAGPRYIEEVVVPELGGAAAEAGRPAPRIVAGVPIAVSSDTDATRSAIREAFAMYNTPPSYQRVIEGSGADDPAGVAIVGSEEEVERELRRWRDVGVTDFYAAVSGEDAEARRRTRAFLRTLTPQI